MGHWLDTLDPYRSMSGINISKARDNAERHLQKIDDGKLPQDDRAEQLRQQVVICKHTEEVQRVKTVDGHVT